MPEQVTYEHDYQAIIMPEQVTYEHATTKPTSTWSDMISTVNHTVDNLTSPTDLGATTKPTSTWSDMISTVNHTVDNSSSPTDLEVDEPSNISVALYATFAVLAFGILLLIFLVIYKHMTKNNRTGPAPQAQPEHGDNVTDYIP